MEEANRFYEVQAKNGVNLEGTFEIQEEIFFKNNLLTALQAFERGELPKYTAEESQRAEAAEKPLISAHKPAATTNWGTVTRAGRPEKRRRMAPLSQCMDRLWQAKISRRFRAELESLAR